MTLIFDVPDSILRELHLTPADLQAEVTKDVALALYLRGVLPMAKAAALAQLSRWDFEELICQRHVTRPFSEEDLAEDLRFARELSKGL